jgi:small subunit ribosomal protein S3Ae
MAVKSAGLKVKAKTWFKIFAPKSFSNEVIGESLVDSAEKLMGKCINVNLSLITGDMKKQGTLVKFKVTEIRPEGGNTEIVGYEIQSASMRRFMRRAVKDIANSFECITADNIAVRIKPVAFISNRVKGSIAALISRTIRFTLIKAIKSKKYVELFNDVVSGKLQREMRERLNKMYPLRVFEIKALEKVEGEGTGKIIDEGIMEEMKETTEEMKEIEQAVEEEAAAAEVKQEETAEKAEEIKAE